MSTKHLRNSLLKSRRMIYTKEYFIVIIHLKILFYGFHFIYLNQKYIHYSFFPVKQPIHSMVFLKLGELSGLE